jgi:iron complex outermembrane receptor protein
MRGFKLVLCLSAAFFVFTCAAQAQEAVELEKTVVTATRTETAVEDLPMSVEIITREELDNMHIKTVDDALSMVAGIRVKRTKGLCTSGGHTVIMMRGMSSTKQIVVLKDGIPLNMTYSGGSVQPWSEMSVEDIERIEVVRGASSALYGSYGMGGVINIITRAPKEKKLAGGLSYEYGDRMDSQTYNLNLRGMAADWLGLRLSAGGSNTHGYKYKKGKDWKEYYKKNDFDRYNISPEIDLKLGKSDLKLQYEHFDDEYTSATSTAYDSESEIDKYTVNYTLPVGMTDLNAKFYYFDYDSHLNAHKYNQTTGKHNEFYYESDIPKDEYGLMLQATREIKGTVFTIGSDLKWGECESDYDYAKGPRYFEGKQKQYSGFLNAELPLFKDRLILSAGVRYDWWKNYDGEFYDNTTGELIEIDYPTNTEDHWSPRAGLAYKLTENTKLRASFGTGFRAPGLYDLYKSGPHGSSLFDIGNPDLEPEEMTFSFDCGFDTRPLYEICNLAEGLELSFTFYHSNYEDFIYSKILEPGEIPSFFTPDPGMDVKQKVNVGKVHVDGIETELDYTFNALYGEWHAFANYTWNRSKVHENDLEPELEGTYLRYVPRRMANLGISYDHPRWFTISCYIRNIGPIYYDEENTKKMGGYTVGDLKVSLKLPRIPGAEAFLNVDNFTNKQYKEYWYDYAPGCVVYSGMKYTF